MQRLHLINANDVSKLSIGNSHVLLPSQMNDFDCRRFYRGRTERGDSLYFYNNKNYKAKSLLKDLKLLGVKCVIVFPEKFRKDSITKINQFRDAGFKTVQIFDREYSFYDEYQYYSALFDNSVSFAIPNINSREGNGFGRFKFIHNLVAEKKFNFDRKHYFFELENPAELTAYAKAFIPKVRYALGGFISSRCYVDSLYGIPYSAGFGLLHTPIDNINIEKTRYSFDQQYSQFTVNDDTIRAFISGRMGEGIWRLYKHAFEGGLHEYNY